MDVPARRPSALEMPQTMDPYARRRGNEVDVIKRLSTSLRPCKMCGVRPAQKEITFSPSGSKEWLCDGCYHQRFID